VVFFVVYYYKKQKTVPQYLHLIAKKLSGEIPPEEEHDLQEWLDASSKNKLLFHRIEEVWHNARHEPYVQGQEKTFEKIAAQLRLSQNGNSPQNKKLSTNIWYYWQRMAAAVLLLVCASLLFVWHANNEKHEIPEENPQPVIVSKSNPRGQKKLITLPDGSQVKLNAESYLEYPSDFSESREVKLVGEAFFEVVRDTLRPFVVTTGGVHVRVLGTSFNVQAFPFEEEMTVAVATGAVMVEKSSKTTGMHTSQLHPREMVKVNHKTGVFEKTRFNPEELLVWKDGILVFQKASFEQIVQKLERWYGVDFIIRRQQPITDGFTGRYDNTSLEVVLEGMSFSSDFTFTIEGDKVIID